MPQITYIMPVVAPQQSSSYFLYIHELLPTLELHTQTFAAMLYSFSSSLMYLLVFLACSIFLPVTLQQSTQPVDPSDLVDTHSDVEIVNVDEWEDDDEDYFDLINEDTNFVTQFSLKSPEGSSPEIAEESLEPGEMGKPYKLQEPTDEQKKLIEEGKQRHSFNEYISDQISLHRSLPDFRNQWCKKPGIYQDNLLPASVVMCFHNEALSVLLRSVHSIMDRTPEELLTEIVLVDDNSELENLKQELEDAIAPYPKVKLVRSMDRLGLIRARMLGADNAQGPILVFLDSHIEVTEGWLQPLADRITRNKTTVVCPIIDVIDDDTLEYKLSERSVTAVGGFSWDMIFTWKTATDEVLRSLKTPADPVPSPTMAGGLFAIHKEFFDRIGQYDEEYEIWGAENLEISFKTWMCGGRLEFVPCSHIGHIYRKRAPYTRGESDKRPHRNYIRLAAVWLDDYAKYYYQKIGNELGDYGDVSKRLELKKELKCQSFDWFIKNVYPDVFNPRTVAGEGEIRNEGFGGQYCLDAMKKTFEATVKPSIYPCHNLGGNQHFYYTQMGEIRKDESCLDFAGGKALTMFPCHGQRGNQMFVYDVEHGFIIHSITSKCLTADSRDEVSMQPCEERITQRWKFTKASVKRSMRVWEKAQSYLLEQEEKLKAAGGQSEEPTL